MMRMLSPLSAWATTSARPEAETPNVRYRNSPSEWSGSWTVDAKSSSNTVHPSRKDTPCLSSLRFAFCRSHSNLTLVPPTNARITGPATGPQRSPRAADEPLGLTTMGARTVGSARPRAGPPNALRGTSWGRRWPLTVAKRSVRRPDGVAASGSGADARSTLRKPKPDPQPRSYPAPLSNTAATSTITIFNTVIEGKIIA